MKNILAGATGIGIMNIIPSQHTIDLMLQAFVAIVTFYFQFRNNKKKIKDGADTTGE